MIGEGINYFVSKVVFLLGDTGGVGVGILVDRKLIAMLIHQYYRIFPHKYT